MLSRKPPTVTDDNTPIGTDLWYYLEAAEIADNETLTDYLSNDPDSLNFQYSGQNSAVFLCFKLAAGIHLPAYFVSYFDNDPAGYYSIKE